MFITALLITIIILGWIILRSIFKIGYYETKLINQHVNIHQVRNMPWYKLWIN